MQSLLRILVKVEKGRSEAELRALAAQMQGLNKAMAGVNRGAAGGFWSGAHFHNIEKWGKDLQWTGRQIEYRFTLPIVAAGIAAGKFALDNERAFTRLRKVYGAFGDESRDLNGELKALRRAFEALSNIFGVTQSEVIDIAADFAQAGAQGIALAKMTRLALETMILGELDAAKAGKSLITIMVSMGMTTDELRSALALLNVVENETAISFGGLIDVIERSGGVARTAGVDIQHLAAMAAALVPATGSAERAGNGLRTILSRLLVPTKEAAELMGLMGINVMETSWTSLNATQRLEKMAKAFVDLEAGQQAALSTTVASRYQINRFDVLMRDIVNPLGNYQKALRVSANEQKNLTQYTKELGIYLSSQPQAFKILWTQLQNALARIIVPLLPAILAVTDEIVKLVQAFTDLPAPLQKVIVMGLAFLAILGPLMAYVGTLAALVGRIGGGLLWFFFGNIGEAAGFVKIGQFISGFFKGILVVIGRLLTSLPLVSRLLAPIFGALQSVAIGFGASAAGASAFAAGVIGAVVAVGALLFIFRRQIADFLVGAWEWGVEQVTRLVNLLPDSVLRAMVGVVNVVKGAALAVYEWLSYLNPFARHSPSLVEQVTAGMDRIEARYGALRGLGSLFRGVTGDIKAFNAATAGTMASRDFAERQEQRGVVAKFAPGALDEFDKLTADLGPLYSALEKVTAAYVEQSRIVTDLENQTALLDLAIRAEEIALNDLERQADASSDALREAEKVLSDLADVRPLGLTAMEDAIFANEQAQARLRLEIMRIEDGIGPISAVEKEVERLEGQANQLRDALEAAKDELNRYADAPITGMKAMQDAIFDNEMAQKALRLEMLKMEQAGQSIEDIQSQMAALAGDMEKLRGEAKELRLAGAGSEITGPIEAEVAAMQAAYDALAGQQSPLLDLQKQLEDLQLQGEILDLEESLAFDPLTKQIEDAVNAMEELPFEEIIAGIGQWKPKVDELQSAYDAANTALADQQALLAELTAEREAALAPTLAELEALERQREQMDLIRQIEFEPALRAIDRLVNPPQEMGYEELRDRIAQAASEVARLRAEDDANTAAVERQKDVVDRLRQAREQVGYVLDVERARLDELGAAYDAIEDQINDIKQAMDDMAAAGRDAASSFNEDLFNAGGDYAIDDLGSGLGFEPGDINALADQWLKESKKSFGNFDIFAPLKDAWKSAVEWIKTDLPSRLMGAITGGLIGLRAGGLGAIVGATLGFIFGPAFAQSINDAFAGAFSGAGSRMGEFFAPVGEALAGLGNFFSPILTVIETLITRFGELASSIGTYVGDIAGSLGDILGPSFEAVGIVASTAWDLLSTVIGTVWRNVLRPIFDTVAYVVGTHLSNVFSTFGALISSVWGFISGVISSAWNSFIYPIFQIMWAVLTTTLMPVFTMFQTVVAIAMELIGRAINLMWDNAGKPVFDAISWIIRTVVGPTIEWLGNNIVGPIFRAIGDVIKAAYDNVITPVFDGIKWAIDNVLNPAFNAIKTVVDTVFQGVLRVIRNAIQWAINIFNKLGDGINAIAGLLGVDSRVARIPDLPEVSEMLGGSKGGGGKGGPSFSASTGGRYLDERGGVPGWGVVKDIAGGVGDVVGDVAGAARTAAVKTTFAPILKAVDILIDRIPIDWLREGMRTIKNDVYNWALGKGTEMDQRGAGGNQPIPEGASTIQRIIGLISGSPLLYRVTSTYRRGDDGYHGRSRAVDFAGPTPGKDSAALLSIWRAFLPYAGNLRELIYSGPGATSYKNGRPYEYSKSVQDDHHDHVHVALATGGIVTRATQALVGEAGPEAVIPLQVLWNKLDAGFQLVNASINRFNFDESLRSARVETNFNLKHEAAAARDAAWLARFNEVASSELSKLDGIATNTARIGEVKEAVNSLKSAIGSDFDSLIAAVQDVTTAVNNIEITSSSSGSSSGGSSSGGSSGGGNIVGPNDIIWGPNGPLAPGTPYDVGGVVRPGLTAVWNRSGANEHILTGRQFDSLVAAAALPADGGGDRHVHLHGDLVLPNITDGEDAEDLISALEALAD